MTTASRSILSATAGLLLAALAHAPAWAAVGPAEACSALAAPGLFPNTTVASAKVMPATATVGREYCEVTATIAPAPGSKIGVVYRLPSDWNGKLIGYGGGGWAGNVRLETAATDLSRGYATLQTDGGAPTANAGDASWTAPGGTPNAAALTDFSWRAVHLMTEIGKSVVARRYGRVQERAYFQGCSTGGRMALMEAQRFPDDYQAIIAGAPVYSLRVQLAEIYRDWIFAQPGAAITAGQIGLVHKAVMAQCDLRDGAADGALTDPLACRFDPKALQCQTGQTGDACLTSAQVQAFQRQYATVRGKDGAVAIFPYSPGSEQGWTGALNITADPVKAGQARDLALRTVMFGDPNFDFARFDAVRDAQRARALPFAKEYEADDADLRPFLSKGGKLILWHGLDDQLPSPWGTVDYYQRVQKTAGAAAQGGVRLFLEPGVLHCGGGPVANSFDMVAALDAWVTQGTTPARIVGVKLTAGPPGAPPPAVPAPPLSRPICAYPALPRYAGQGDPNDAANFACR